MADRYWVGGTGTWSSTNTANWSASSGGASGASVPTAADDVFFDANSNTGTTAFTVTMANTPRVCNNITISGLDGAMTLAGSNIGLTVSGNLSFPATNFTRTYTGTTTFNSTTTGKTITTNGVAFGAPVTFDGVGGGWVLQDALSTGAGTATTTTLTNGTLDLNNQTLTTGRFASNNSNTRTIAFGTGNITCIGNGAVWNTLTVTGLTTTGTQVVNVTSTGSTAISFTPGALSEANSISYNFTGGTYALSLNGTSTTVRSLNFTGYAGTYSEVLITTIYGNLTLSTGMSLTASTFTWSFRATSGTQLITTNGKTLDFPVTFNGVGGTFRLEDAFTIGSTRTMTLTNGTLNLNGKTCTVGTRFTTATGTKNLTFNGGTLVCPDPNTTSFNNAAPTNFTTTAGTGTGTISMTAATAKTFVGGGSTFNCTLNQGGAGTLTITGANTFNDITNTNTTASQITFPASTTTTVNNFTLAGSSGNLVSIRSSTGGTRFTLSKSSGTVSVSFLDIQDSNATGGATWNASAGNGNVDSGNNLGWVFAGFVDGVAVITCDATVVGVASANKSFIADITANATVDALGYRIKSFAGDIAANATISAIGSEVANGIADISAAATVDALGYRIKAFAGDITANATVDALGYLIKSFAGDISATGTVVIDATRVRTSVGDITGNATVSGDPNVTFAGFADIQSFADVSAYANVRYSGFGIINATADVFANGQIVGEEWGDTTPTSSTWTTSSPAVSGWSNVAGTSSTWLRQ